MILRGSPEVVTSLYKVFLIGFKCNGTVGMNYCSLKIEREGWRSYHRVFYRVGSRPGPLP